MFRQALAAIYGNHNVEDEEEGSDVSEEEEMPANGVPHDEDGSGDHGIALPDGETDIEAFSERNSSADEDFDSNDHDANILDVSHENNVDHVTNYVGLLRNCSS